MKKWIHILDKSYDKKFSNWIDQSLNPTIKFSLTLLKILITIFLIY